MWCPINWGSIVSVAQEYVERLSRDEVRTDTYSIVEVYSTVSPLLVVEVPRVAR